MMAAAARPQGANATKHSAARTQQARRTLSPSRTVRTYAKSNLADQCYLGELLRVIATFEVFSPCYQWQTESLFWDTRRYKDHSAFVMSHPHRKGLSISRKLRAFPSLRTAMCAFHHNLERKTQTDM